MPSKKFAKGKRLVLLFKGMIFLKATEAAVEVWA
jgi:hypothetical protein